jgi:hypothetical protein
VDRQRSPQQERETDQVPDTTKHTDEGSVEPHADGGCRTREHGPHGGGTGT